MAALEQSRTVTKWEKVSLTLGAVFFVVGVILAVYALAIFLESAEKLRDDPDDWEQYWPEREDFHITLRISAVFFFVLSMVHLAIWFHFRGKRKS